MYDESVCVCVCSIVTVPGATSSMWSVRPPNAASDEETSVASHEPDVEYTEVVHPRATEPAKVPLKKGTDTVYTELQNSPLSGAAADHEYDSLQYAELNITDPLAGQDDNHHHHHDLPVPVD